MTIYKAVEIPSDVPVSHVGVHPVKWHERPEQPTTGFVPLDLENLALNLTTEVLRELNQRNGFDDLWHSIDPELRMEIVKDLQDSIQKILEGITI